MFQIPRQYRKLGHPIGPKNTQGSEEREELMNEVIDMNETMTVRTPQLIASEINLIKRQTHRIVLSSAIDIGRRLTEIKKQVKYGEWGRWLKEEVSYSQDTAEKMMRLYQEYGVKQLSIFTDGEPDQEIPELSFSQAYILLGVPEKERAAFITDTDVARTSTRELQKAIDDWNQARRKKEQAEQEKAVLQQALEEEKEKSARLAQANAVLDKNAQELFTAKSRLERKAENLQNEVTSIKKTTAYKSLNSLRKNLSSASTKVRANNIAFLYGELDRVIKELWFQLDKIKQSDPDTFVAYKDKVYEFLIQRARDEMWAKDIPEL